MGRSTSCDKSGLKKGPWTAEEDQKLIDYIQKHGHGRWRTLPKNAGLKRCGKSCRLRWTNYLRPDIKRGKFSLEEEETILQLHSIMGNKWSTIAARLPGRTDNEIKNYWNTHLKKRLVRMGIDPVTHKPRLDLLQLYSVLNSSLCSTSQLNHFPSLLANGSMLNPSLISSFTSQLSCKGSSQALSPKKFPDYHLGGAQVQVQNQSATLQTNHFHDQMEAYSNSPSAQLINQPQFMHSNLEQISSDPTSINHQNPLQGLWQANRQPTNIADSFIPNCGYQNTHQTIIHAKSAENLPNLRFTSLLSTTPSSTTTPLNSSTAYVNGSNEDERDRYCSNMPIFDNIPNSLAVSGLI